MLDDIKDFLEDYWILILMGAALVGFVIWGFVIWLFVPRDYTLDIRRVQWENVKYHYHPRTKTWTDDDGNTHTKDESYWTYDYDINRWIETRKVVTTDYDHEPLFGEYTLKESDREDGIGAERAIEEKIYRALGTEIHGDGELVDLVIPEDMWETLKDTDEINYKQAKVGGPRDPVVAK